MPLYRVEVSIGDRVVDVYDDYESDSADLAELNCRNQTIIDLSARATPLDEDGARQAAEVAAVERFATYLAGQIGHDLVDGHLQDYLYGQGGEALRGSLTQADIEAGRPDLQGLYAEMAAERERDSGRLPIVHTSAILAAIERAEATPTSVAADNVLGPLPDDEPADRKPTHHFEGLPLGDALGDHPPIVASLEIWTGDDDDGIVVKTDRGNVVIDNRHGRLTVGCWTPANLAAGEGARDLIKL